MQEQVLDQDLLAALFVRDSKDIMDRIIWDFAADDSDGDSKMPTSWILLLTLRHMLYSYRISTRDLICSTFCHHMCFRP